MRRALILTGAIACCAVLPAPAQAGGPATGKNCAVKGSRTLAVSAAVRVYSTGDRAYGCHKRRRTSYFLGARRECRSQTRASDFRPAGTAVGYIQTSCGAASSQSELRVIDLRNGRLRNGGRAVDFETNFGGEFSVTIERWKIRRSGSVAWIGGMRGFVTTPETGPAPPDNYQVWKSERGQLTKLDEGSDIGRRSLAGSRGNSRISWRKGQTAFSATLR
jgi:hypothetical protein